MRLWLALAFVAVVGGQLTAAPIALQETAAPSPHSAAPSPSASPASAQAPLSVTPPQDCRNPASLAARGVTTVYTRPDLATIDLAITATAPSAARARELAANTSAAILGAVESVDGVGRGGMAASTAGAFLARALEEEDAAASGVAQAPPPSPPPAPSSFRFRQAFVISVRDPEGGHSEGGGFEGAVSRALDAAVGAASDAGNKASAGNGTAVLTLSGVRAGLSPPHAAEAAAAAREGAIADLKNAAARDAAALGLRLGGLASFGPPRPVPGVPSAAATVDDALGSAATATTKAATAGLPPPGPASPTPVVLGDVPTAASVEGTFWVCDGEGGQGRRRRARGGGGVKPGEMVEDRRVPP